MRLSARLLLPLSLVASAQATLYEVTVGKNGLLKFVPDTVKAKAGDTIRYSFYAKNHSVAVSSFKEPCQPLEGGFFSGFVPTQSADNASSTRFEITVKDEKPLWVYCSQTNGDHCQKGMVMAINAPDSGNTLEAYKKAAENAPTSKSPSNGLPTGGIRRTTVTVGGSGKLSFLPNNIVEPKGTVVNFSFSPGNHSVVQSSFDKPCQPLADGFSSGFIPLKGYTPNVVYAYTVDDNEPVWFYCAQTTGNHCQNGMVGSINAPTIGNTLEAYIANAEEATPPSLIPPEAPLGGLLTIDGDKVNEGAFNGAVWPGISSPSASSSAATTGTPTTTAPPDGSNTIPPPGPDAPAYYTERAGGGKPVHWGWAANLSEDATAYLQLHARIEGVILHLLDDVHAKLDTDGPWAGTYPQAIVDTIGAWLAQSLVHRATTAECLEHYERPVLADCTYKLPTGSVDEFLAAFAKLNAMQIGVMVYLAGELAEYDPFMVPVMMSQVGAKSRAAAVVNMMQNHMAASAPREVSLPAALAWSFVTAGFLESCPDFLDGQTDKAKPWPLLTVSNKIEEGGRTVSVDVEYTVGDMSAVGDTHFVVWLGQYGSLEFVEIEKDTKTVLVPAGLYGDVWVAVVNSEGLDLQELAPHLVAGPEMIWVNEP